MKIQSINTTRLYHNTDRIGNAKIGASTTDDFKLPDLLKTQTTGSSAEQVNISDAARRLASVKGAVTQARTVSQQRILDRAASDPRIAEEFAYNKANIYNGAVYDLRGVSAGDPMNIKLASGRIVDHEFNENFDKEGLVIQEQLKEIYDSEKARGTPDAQILAKLFDFTNTQSRDYLEATDQLGPPTNIVS